MSVPSSLIAIHHLELKRIDESSLITLYSSLIQAPGTKTGTGSAFLRCLSPFGSLTLVPRQVPRDRLLGLRIGAGIQMEMVLVDINDLNSRLLALDRKWIAAFHRLGVVHRALPVAVVQLSRPDQREEANGIDLIHQALTDNLDVVAEFFVEIGDAAGDVRQRPQHGRLVRRILA